MKLTELLAGLTYTAPDAGCDLDRDISGLALDSRTLTEGQAFIALAGSQQHGLSHLKQAIENGACAVLYDPADGGRELAATRCDIPMLAIEHLSQRLGELAARFYRQPSQHLDVIGITGTNGKTSCSQFLAQALDHCGIIGTLGWGEWGRLNKTLNTTPDALAIQQMLATLAMSRKRAVAMEVSSHGLEQGRVNGVRIKGAVFTNLSRDHLDYHGTMDAYLNAKLTLLDKPGLDFVIVNLDDATSRRIIAAVPETARIWGVSAEQNRFQACNEHIAADRIGHQPDGIAFDACWRNERQRITAPLYGDFNVENLLQVLAVLLAMDMSLHEAARRLARVKPIAGRMQRFGGNGRPLVFVDYAHTPDALDKVLASLRKHCRRDLWVVIGCGGDRDRGKRPLMGAAAERWADHVLLTDDNPRNENGNAIIDAMLAGCRSDNTIVIRDRELAIRSAIRRAAGDDIVVVAGKGHEDYQEIQGVRYPFNDKDIVLDALDQRPE